MQSRLLSDLDQKISTSEDAVSWSRAVCRKASHFARQGQSQLALEQIGKVRAFYGTQLEPEAACWLMLAEGILHFFQLRSDEAYDRLRRAYGVSNALQVANARPTCAAWMAHIEFNESRFDSMCLFLKEALKLAAANDHQAQARAALVFADAIHFAGSFAKAKPWYQRARLHATEEGDEATLSALLHNVAAFRAVNIRIADAFGEALPSEAKQASLEAASALNYDRAIGTESFDALVPLLQAQLMIVDHKFDEADAILGAVDPHSVPERLAPLVTVDRASCASAKGNHSLGRLLADEAIAQSARVSEPDDRAYLFARYSTIAKQSGFAAGTSEALARVNLGKHRQLQADLMCMLDQVSLDLSGS